MRPAIAIFLLLLLTVTQTPLGQLAKLPLLLEHFSKHKKESNMSLTQFFGAHYFTDHNDGDRSEDEKLPFKTIILQTIGFAIMPVVACAGMPVSFMVPPKLMLPDFYAPQQHLFSIFHPPRRHC